MWTWETYHYTEIYLEESSVSTLTAFVQILFQECLERDLGDGLVG